MKFKKNTIKGISALCVILACFSCQKENNGEGPISLEGTTWKLAGIVENKKFKVSLNPQAKNFADSEKKLRCIGGKILLDIAKTA